MYSNILPKVSRKTAHIFPNVHAQNFKLCLNTNCQDIKLSSDHSVG